jgi:surfeit locus 1 family protein
MQIPASSSQMNGKQPYNKYFKKIFSILIVLLIIICLRAGVWQLDRAEYKKQQAVLFEHSQQDNYVDFINASANNALVNYKKVQIEEVIDKKVWHIDNQINDKKVGVKQLQFIFLPENKENVFIVLHWQEKLYDTENIFFPLTGQVKIEGFVKKIDTNPYLNTEGFDNSITALPALDKKLLSIISDKPVNPYIIYAHRINGKAISTNQMAPSFNPEKHLGYALQWFIFALMLFGYSIFLVYQSTKKH